MARRLLRALAAAAALCFAGGAAHAQAALEATLRPYLARHELPALAAAVVVRGKLVAAGAVGTRRAGTSIPVTREDRFQLGSHAQAMTALLAGMQVESGGLLWSSTVGEVFSELANGMNPALSRVTLEQLLSHTSGLPIDNDLFARLLRRALLEDGSLEQVRYWLLREWSALPLAALPGTQRVPATMNYVIAAAMIERSAGRPWEELIVHRIFDALDLRHAGLGPAASLGRIHAPLGHVAQPGRILPIASGPGADAPPLLGPAAGVHMSVLDFARWCGWYAGRGRQGTKLVEPETLDRAGGFAWRAQPRDWAARPLLHHAGSTATSHAHAWLDAETGLAMVLLTNVGGPKASAALDALAQELYRAHAPR